MPSYGLSYSLIESHIPESGMSFAMGVYHRGRYHVLVCARQDHNISLKSPDLEKPLSFLEWKQSKK
jgi:hypothetical protein